MPAEWEPHAATWIAWPHNPTDWPGKLSAIYWVYADITKKLAASEPVNILVNSSLHERRARSVLQRSNVPLDRVTFHRIRTDRAWIRDFGPLFVLRETKRKRAAIARFRFNGWARYEGWHDDDAVPVKIARALGLPLLPASRGRGFVLEGGSIDVNGCGTLLTTEECLLDQDKQARNPGTDQATVERILKNALGVTNMLWLRSGIVGDDTHGHVDDFCRFVAPGRVAIAHENISKDANYAALHQNWERLQGFRLENGQKLDVIPLPMPSPAYYNGMRLPASYANFYIGNRVVLVPTFNDTRDPMALGILGELFPDRQVVGVHALDLLWGLGGIHCITMQQPKA